MGCTGAGGPAETSTRAAEEVASSTVTVKGVAPNVTGVFTGTATARSSAHPSRPEGVPSINHEVSPES